MRTEGIFMYLFWGRQETKVSFRVYTCKCYTLLTDKKINTIKAEFIAFKVHIDANEYCIYSGGKSTDKLYLSKSRSTEI